MNRRRWLGVFGTTAACGLAGCLGRLRAEYDSLTEKRLFEYGDYATALGFRVTTLSVVTYRVVRYQTDESENATLWEPGSDREIAIASYRVDRLESNGADWPDPADFHLVTAEMTVEPTFDTPGGQPVSTIRTPGGGRVRSPEEIDQDDTQSRLWDAVYVIDRSDTDRLTTKWIGPSKPVFWFPSGR